MGNSLRTEGSQEQVASHCGQYQGVGSDADSDTDLDADVSTARSAVHVNWPDEPLDPDTFGLAVCSLVRDLHLLHSKKGPVGKRYWRLATTFTLVAICLAIQIFLLVQVKKYVSAKAVHDIREVYDNFEVSMYGGHVYVYRDEPFLERRGMRGRGGPYFNASAFATLDADVQAAVCRIPLTQPYFIGTVLLVWTIACLSDVRKCTSMFDLLIYRARTIKSMKDAKMPTREEMPEHSATEEAGVEAESGDFVVRGLTMGAKASIFLLVILPRYCCTLFLLWLGCRWLLATSNFSDLILNGLALEFILMLKDALYMALASKQSQVELGKTFIDPGTKSEPEKAFFFLTLVGIAVALAWVIMYMGTPMTSGLQRVLGDYQWDVREVCASWVRERYAV